MAKAFDGVRIIDFSQVLAGPWAAQHLGLLGADIVKIEQPGGGDQGRMMFADGEFFEKKMSPLAMSANAGKRSITLDLKNPKAKEIVHRLVEDADVLVENFKAGNMDRLGFGYEAIRAINPKIVYCSVSGFGQHGPMSGVAAYDGAIQAASGMMSITGHPETGPVRAGFMAVDLSTGITGAFAIASALYRRAMTGEGQYLDVAMYDSALYMMAPNLSAYLVAGNMQQLIGNLSPALVPTGDTFPTRNGFIQVTVLTDRQFVALCTAFERPEWAEDARFATHDARMENRQEVRDMLRAAFAEDTADSWQERLAAVHIPCSRVATIPEAVDHPQLRHRKVLTTLDAPGNMDRDITVVTTGFMAGDDGPEPRGTMPTIGEHTDAILGEIGYSVEEIAALREAGTV